MTPIPADDTLSSAEVSAMTRAMARNVAEWHDASVRAHGIQTHWTDTLWWREPGGSPIYVGAIVLSPETDNLQATLRPVQDAYGAESPPVYDAWDMYKADDFSGEVLFAHPWYVRLPAPFTAPKPPTGISVDRVTTTDELEAFERATIEGFADSVDALQDYRRFGQHAAATLKNPDMIYLLARLHGSVVASTIAHITDDMLGIYGLSTLFEHRRRGYARTLINASVALRPDLPASVHPDPPSVPIYTEIGFRHAGDIAVWKPR